METQSVTITIPTDLLSKIRERGNDTDATVRDALEAFFQLMDVTAQTMKGRFSLKEAALLCDIFRSTQMDIERLADWPDIFAWDVEDTEKYEKLGERVGVNAEALAEKLGALQPIQTLWLHDRIRIFWNRAASDEENRELLAELFG
ncbi:MAG: hypothetical protein JXO48_01730 [Deltaproteobacteria bacterium]|nr:hypothetical protein [Deltaproteobacteria bacterium]